MSENIHTAMLAIQNKLKNPLKSEKANYGNYANLPDIRDDVTPILAESGLYLMQLVQMGDMGAYLQTVITHAATGANISSSMPLMLEKQTPQGMGSAITYARRYALCAMLNITGDKDDDGQKGSDTQKEKNTTRNSTIAKPTKEQKLANPMPDSEYEQHRAAIMEAGDLNSLKIAFNAACDKAREYGDGPAANGFITIKDARKVELEKAEQGGA